MKDWKTYAIFALTAWCAWLTLHEPKERIVKSECVDELMREAFKWSYGNGCVWKHFGVGSDKNTWNNEECLNVIIDSAKTWAKRRRENTAKNDETSSTCQSE